MKKIFIPFIFSAFLLAGCSQDRLDIPQKGVVSKDDFYKTDEDAQMALVAAYDAAATNYVAPLYNDNIIYALWNYVGDDMIAAGNNKTDNIAQNELNAFRFPTNNQLINVGYTSFFRAVYAANLVIDNFKDGTTPFYTLQHGGRSYAAIFNYEGSEQTISMNPAEAGLPAAGTAVSANDGSEVKYDGALTVTLDAYDSVIFELK